MNVFRPSNSIYIMNIPLSVKTGRTVVYNGQNHNISSIEPYQVTEENSKFTSPSLHAIFSQGSTGGKVVAVTVNYLTVNIGAFQEKVITKIKRDEKSTLAVKVLTPAQQEFKSTINNDHSGIAYYYHFQFSSRR